MTNLQSVQWEKIDLLFTSLPTGQSQVLVNKLIKFKNLKVIDLAADFRINDKSKYKEYYGKDYRSNNILKSSIYSLSEFVKDKIKKFNIISCPGCYPTSIQIPLLPLIK